MVEALVVIVVLIILDASVLYMNDAYAASLATLRNARTAAWTSAITACRGGGSTADAVVGGAGSDGSLGPSASELRTALSVARGPTLTKPLRTDVPVTSAFAQRGSRGYADYAGLHLSSRSTVICNELQMPISEGDVRMTIDSFYGEFF